MPADMVQTTTDTLPEIGLPEEDEQPRVERVVDREPANGALARLGRWRDDPGWR
jgi:hypothetical protein